MRRAYLLISAALLSLLATSPSAADETAAAAPSAPPGIQTSALPATPVAACPTGVPVAKNFNSGETICVRALDDSGNPYRSYYGPVDQWAWQHPASPDREDLARRAHHDLPKTPIVTEPWQAVLILPVDAAGWPLPFAEFQDRVHRLSTYRRPPLPGESVREYHAAQLAELAKTRLPAEQRDMSALQGWRSVYMYAAEGPMPPEIFAIWEKHFHAWQADAYPVIPAWLGENPPLATVFLPDDTILAYGGLGLRYEDPPAGSFMTADSAGLNAREEKWYRYSRDGKLLETRPAVDNPTQWMTSWSGGFADSQRGNRESYPGFMVESRYSTHSGSQETNEPVAAYLWDGSQLALGAPAPNFGPGVADLIRRDTLVSLYRTQLRSGRTTRSSLSPYAGTPDGPVVTDPEPRPLPRDIRQIGLQGGSGKPRPLDDPANPYRESYTQWDRWIYEHVGQSNPLEQAHYQAEVARWEKLRDEARKNRLPDPPKTVIKPYEPAPDSPWRRVTARLDAEGWLIPIALTPPTGLFLERDYRNSSSWSRPEQVISASGELPPASWAELEAAQTAARRAAFARAFPPLPWWLKGRPVHNITFLPDGTVITYGGPGSYEPEGPEGSDPAFSYPGTGGRIKGVPFYYRYSASGELLGELDPRGDLGWLPLTWPRALEVYLGAGMQGQEAQVRDGYLLVYAGPTVEEKTNANGRTIRVAKDPPPPLVAAYDWDGTTMDITQPLRRLDGCGVPVRWEDIGE